MRAGVALMTFFLLAGCVGSPSREARSARFDLGDPQARWPAAGVRIRQVEVRAAPWLESTAQYYRLNHSTPLRRQSYAESRWVAPPGVLLEQWLKRLILPRQPPGDLQRGCRLVIWLDELEQRFASASSSEVVLAARAALMLGPRMLAQENLQIARPAATPDSAGGVIAARAAVQALAESLAERWHRDASLAEACARG
jgi:cholesterol transport system auxiliary component